MRLLAAVLLAVVSFGANELSNRRAPGFALPDSTFKRYDLQDFRGKWLLIDFMETNCPHCRALAPVLEQIKRKFPGRVGVVSVVIAPPETQLTVAKYIRENNVTAPVLYDQGQMAASYFEATPSKPGFDTPHVFIIDPQGRIVRDYSHPEGPALMKELDGLVR